MYLKTKLVHSGIASLTSSREDTQRESKIIQEIALFLNLPYSDISKSVIDQKICQKIPENFAREHNILILYQLGDILTIAFQIHLN